MFKFRLKRVLDFISKEEIAKKMELARALQKAEETRQRIQSAEGEIRGLLTDPTKQSVVWLQYAGERSEFQLDEIKRHEENLTLQLVEVGKRKQTLAQTSAKRRGLEMLRDKREKDYRLDQRRKEQIRQDDVYQILKAGKE